MYGTGLSTRRWVLSARGAASSTIYRARLYAEGHTGEAGSTDPPYTPHREINTPTPNVQRIPSQLSCIRATREGERMSIHGPFVQTASVLFVYPLQYAIPSLNRETTLVGTIYTGVIRNIAGLERTGRCEDGVLEASARLVPLLELRRSTAPPEPPLLVILSRRRRHAGL